MKEKRPSYKFEKKSKDDLMKGLEILKYEEDMLRATFEELARERPGKFTCSSGNSVDRSYPFLEKYPPHISVAILESFLIHVRIFIEFLYSNRELKNNSSHKNDILAEDYFEPPAKWHEIIKNEPNEFINTKADLNKYLAHLSLIRKRSELDKQWNCPKLYEWITSGLILFHKYNPYVL